MTATAATQNTVVRYIRDLYTHGGFSGTDIASFTDVSKSTVHRWANGAAAPKPETQLFLSDLHYIVQRLDEYYSPQEVRAWLYARHPQLDGERAIDVILNDASTRVLAILDRLDADVYL